MYLNDKENYMMLDDVKQKLIQYCENNFRLKEVKEEVDGDKEYVREVVRKFGTLKGKTYSMDLGTYVISVSIPIKTKLVDDFVIQIKKIPEIIHTVVYSIQIPYYSLYSLAKDIAKGRLGCEPNVSDIEQVMKEFSNNYVIGTGIDEEKFKQAVESQTVSAEKVKGLFKEEEGTPAIKVSDAKTAI